MTKAKQEKEQLSYLRDVCGIMHGLGFTADTNLKGLVSRGYIYKIPGRGEYAATYLGHVANVAYSLSEDEKAFLMGQKPDIGGAYDLLAKGVLSRLDTKKIDHNKEVWVETLFMTPFGGDVRKFLQDNDLV